MQQMFSPRRLSNRRSYRRWSAVAGAAAAVAMASVAIACSANGEQAGEFGAQPGTVQVSPADATTTDLIQTPAVPPAIESATPRTTGPGSGFESNMGTQGGPDREGGGVDGTR
jgi:hypothetical protein